MRARWCMSRGVGGGGGKGGGGGGGEERAVSKTSHGHIPWTLPSGSTWS